MTREELLKSREYWITKIQLDLFELIENYRKENHLTKTQLAEKLGVTKGYISQILNGDFDHKISKLVDLALAFGKVPVVKYENIEQYAGRREPIQYQVLQGSEMIVSERQEQYRKRKK